MSSSRFTDCMDVLDRDGRSTATAGLSVPKNAPDLNPGNGPRCVDRAASASHGTSLVRIGPKSRCTRRRRTMSPRWPASSTPCHVGVRRSRRGVRRRSRRAAKRPYGGTEGAFLSAMGRWTYCPRATRDTDFLSCPHRRGRAVARATGFFRTATGIEAPSGGMTVLTAADIASPDSRQHRMQRYQTAKWEILGCC